MDSHSVLRQSSVNVFSKNFSLLHHITGTKQIIQYTLLEQILCEQIYLKNEDPDVSVAASAILLYSADFKWWVVICDLTLCTSMQ